MCEIKKGYALHYPYPVHIEILTSILNTLLKYINQILSEGFLIVKFVLIRVIRLLSF